MHKLPIVLLLLAACCRGFAAEPAAPPPTPKAALAELRAIKVFAFGGVGYAGVTSKGELAYRALAGGTNALEMLTSLLTNGTDEARLYALCGIRSLAPRSFERYADPVSKTNATVTTMAGCIVLEEPASNVVARIRNGFYDVFLQKVTIGR